MTLIPSILIHTALAIMSDQQVVVRLYVPPHRRASFPLPERLQTSLLNRQRLNLRRKSSMITATRMRHPDRSENQEDEEDADLNAVSSAYSLATHRSRQQAFLNSKEGDGPGRKIIKQPTYTEVAILFLDLDEGVAFLDPNKARQMVIIAGEEIREVKYAGSYKWVEGADRPTLAVPGELNETFCLIGESDSRS